MRRFRQRCALVSLTLLAGAALPGVAQPSAPAAPPAHPREFWRAIVAHQYAVPPGEDPAALLLELCDVLGHPDPEWRDEFGYSITTDWIYEKELLRRPQLLVLMTRWLDALKDGAGETAGDGVLKRSFAALNLSTLVAYDNKTPFLESAEFRRVLDAAIAYAGAERDMRGYVEPLGWVHAAAHTADLLKFLSRSRFVTREDQARIADALVLRATTTGTTVFTFGEGDRLALAFFSLARRKDGDAPAFSAALAKLAAATKGAEAARLDLTRWAAATNARQVLQSLYVVLSLAEAPTRHMQLARDAVLRTLKGL